MGRRRLAYPIDHHREGSTVILFEAPATAISDSSAVSHSEECYATSSLVSSAPAAIAGRCRADVEVALHR